MTEFEQLEEVCNVIGYKNKRYYFGDDYIIEEEYNESSGLNNRNVDIREIIFTQEFMDKYFMALYDKGIRGDSLELQHTHILQNLENIVQYLYDTLLGKIK